MRDLLSSVSCLGPYEVVLELPGAEAHGFEDKKDQAGIAVDRPYKPVPVQLEDGGMAEGHGGRAAGGTVKKRGDPEHLPRSRHGDLHLAAARLEGHDTDIAALNDVKGITLIPLTEYLFAMGIGPSKGALACAAVQFLAAHWAPREVERSFES